MTDVTQPSSPVVPEVTTPPQAEPGSKTPPENLLAALQEARDEIKRLKQINNPSEYAVSDEGKMLENRIKKLEEQLENERETNQIKLLENQYPIIKDKSSEFDTFRKEYPRHKLENVAKLFLAENGLLDLPQRKGLEQPTGGAKTPSGPSMSVDEVRKLRETNFRKYTELVMSGKINPADLKS